MRTGKLIMVALAAAAALLAVPSAATAGSEKKPHPVHPANAAWPGTSGRSGVNGDPTINAASVNAFCSWRGRACNVAQSYTDRTSWASMTTGSGWAFDNFAGFSGQLVVSQSLVPRVPTVTWRRARRRAQPGLEELRHPDGGQGRRDTVVRLGWEFNEHVHGVVGREHPDLDQLLPQRGTNIRSTIPGRNSTGPSTRTARRAACAEA